MALRTVFGVAVPFIMAGFNALMADWKDFDFSLFACGICLGLGVAGVVSRVLDEML